MPVLERSLKVEVAAALKSKMVFIGGARQVGKTTLALSLLAPRATERHPAYLNWDDPKIPPGLRRGELPAGEPVVVLDEIHKYARWRNLVKGLYDTEKSFRRILVTGSARLDHYRKGGDSLAGRYLPTSAVRRVGATRGRWCMLSAARLPAAVAAGVGLADRVVPRAGLAAVVEDELRQIAAAEPAALRATKRIVRNATDLPLPQALDAAALEFAGLLRHGAVREGIAATREKRAPAWQVAVPPLPDFT